jgi:hypothetical protein
LAEIKKPDLKYGQKSGGDVSEIEYLLDVITFINGIK